jgi:glycosyltransferase 2 family protein
VLHLYGRAIAARDQGAPLSIASLSVLLDTLLMATGGVIIGLFCIPRPWKAWAIVAVGGILLILHPKILGPLLDRLSQLRKKPLDGDEVSAPSQTLSPWPLAGRNAICHPAGVGLCADRACPNAHFTPNSTLAD